MRRSAHRCRILAAVALATAFSIAPLSRADEDPRALELFENRIRPLLAESCYRCHSAEKGRAKGGLTLDTRSGWAKGGDNGPAIVPGDPDASLLVRAIRYESPDLQMPPKRRLDDGAIADIVRWIESGAHDPRVEPASGTARESDTIDIAKRKASHWAWRPVSSPTPPEVARADWPRTAVDRFLLARLEAAGLEPAPPADPRALIRRASFIVTGLPPTPEDVEAFAADPSDEAYAALVDRLLESPHFGEAWAQHWLDLVRFAETRGHEQDYDIPEAWRYRDYVIRALNSDLPYDRFVVEHVAGDLVEEPRLDPEDRTNQSIQGTGFWHLGEGTHSPVDIRGDEAERVHNQLDVFSKTFLGLSIGCARCHDHKFDAISSQDYYALFGYLQSSSYRLADVSDPARRAEVLRDLLELREARSPRVREAFAALRERQLARWPEHLTTAAEALAVDDESARGELLEASASERRLDLATLQALAVELPKARDDARSPLHAFAALALDREARDPSAFAGRRARVLERLEAEEAAGRERLARQQVVRSEKDGERNYTAVSRPWDESDVVESFEVEDPESWITDGERFGPRPGQPGELLIGFSAEQPVARVLDETAAESDSLSRSLRGMLRTRTFEVVGDQLWYRYRGSAEVFLAVDSHRVVAGPLHGVVKQRLDGAPDEWRWHAHSVRDYLGHRVHVEFTPGDGFALDRVVFSAGAPPDLAPVDPLVRQLLEDPAVVDVPSLAREFAAIWRRAVDDLAGGELAGSAHARSRARLLDWTLRHEALLPAEPEALAALRAEFESYSSARAEIEGRLPPAVRALALLDGSGENEPVHVRGNHRTLSDEVVPRSILTALGGDEMPAPTRGSGRLELARRLVSAENPLVRRVLVNRAWHHVFGRGIVETVDDLGAMGKPPSHPELLDWLATRFLEQGWSLKALLRQLLLSSAFRMSSAPSPEAEEKDGANLLLHRFPIRRMTAEWVRDHVLSVSGRLDTRLHGPSVRVHITPFMRSNRSPGWSGPVDGDGRRSIYIEVRRNHLSAMLLAFDKPSPFMTLGKRLISNSPAQPLILLNDPFVHAEAERWAQRLLRERTDEDGRIERAYLLAFARPPEAMEREAALAFIESQAALHREAGESAPDRAAWTDLCHTLMNVKEFIFLR